MTEIDRIHCVLLAGLALKGLALRPSGILHFYFEHFVVHTDTAASPRLASLVFYKMYYNGCAMCVLVHTARLEIARAEKSYCIGLGIDNFSFLLI